MVGIQRYVNGTIVVRPAAVVASTISRACSASSATGFSHSRWIPRSAAASTIAWCVSFGDAMITASTVPPSSMASQSVCTSSMPQRAAKATVRSGSRPHTAVMAPSGWSARAGRYMASAHQLVPMMPMRTVIVPFPPPRATGWPGRVPAGGAVVRRTTSVGDTNWSRTVVREPRMRSSNASNASRPIVDRGWSMVVSPMWCMADKAVLS